MRFLFSLTYLTVVALVGLACPAFVQAISLIVSNNSVAIGESVTVTISGEQDLIFTPVSYGSLRIDFGDGTPPQTIPVSGGLGFLVGTTLHVNQSATHAYAGAGKYTITGTGINGTNPWVPPRIVTQAVTVTDQVAATLPRGEVGIEYEHLLQSLSGPNNNYRLIRGILPPGLKLEAKGSISGIPTQKGAFTFTLQITNARGFSSPQTLTIYIDPGRLVVEPSPEMINVTVGGAIGQQITFTVVHPTVPLPDTARSSQGEFIAGGQVIGVNRTPLTINLNSSRPAVSESVAVPQSVLMAAQNAGTNRIIYRRTFSSQNLTPGSADSKVSLRTPASGELRITKMRIYFEQNNRPLILVERNTRELTGVVEIHYNGSGELSGYWLVGSRIIQRVQKHIFYGKVLTLKTPSAPPLPTYSEGAHSLRFIITQPASAEQQIEFPEAIYHVEAKKAEIVTAITLKTPVDKAEVDSTGALFSWSEDHRISNYYLEFFDADAQEPFFTAYTKQGNYQLVNKVIDLKFTKGDSFRWRVRGFNEAGELAGKSEEQTFTLIKQAAYVPGQILFLVENSEAGRQLIPRITAKYDLKIIEQTDLRAINRILVICSTDLDIIDLSARLKQEDGLYLSQPNFIFDTLENDPLRSMQSIHQLLDLDQIQQKASGKYVLVAIIDTGVDLDHRDLQGRIREHQNFIDGSPYVGEIHGTAVAGIIAATRNDFGILGIAPESELIALRACEQRAATKPNGQCYSTSVAKAIDTAISRQANIANLSLGGQQEDTLVGELLSKAHQQGMVLVAPVGNDPKAETPAFPASHPDVTSVAGFDGANEPVPNRKLALAADAAAPARDIFSTTPGNRHNFMDGTSFSAATISGIIALSLELHQNAVPQNFPHFGDSTGWSKQVLAFFDN